MFFYTWGSKRKQQNDQNTMCSFIQSQGNILVDFSLSTKSSKHSLSLLK